MFHRILLVVKSTCAYFSSCSTTFRGKPTASVEESCNAILFCVYTAFSPPGLSTSYDDDYPPELEGVLNEEEWTEAIQRINR